MGIVRLQLRPFRLLTLVTATILVVVGANQRSPALAASGKGLGVVLALVGFVAATVAVMRIREDARLLIPLFVLLIASSSALMWLQPHGGGFLGTFIAVGAAADSLPLRRSIPIAALAAAGLTVATIASDTRSISGIALLEIGLVAFFTMAVSRGQLRAAHEELQETREAQVRAAALGERQRLAREMHDVLAHSLSALLLQLEGARLLARDRGDEELGDAVERAHQLAKSGLDEARRAIETLRDDELPGPDRVGALAEEFEQDTAVPCVVDVAGTPRELAPEARLAVYRVAQEALTNVRRHAHAERVELALAYEDDGVRLVVEDVGASRNGTSGSGYGLTGMRERAELLGGRLAAGSTDAGFRVELWIPA